MTKPVLKGHYVQKGQTQRAKFPARRATSFRPECSGPKGYYVQNGPVRRATTFRRVRFKGPILSKATGLKPHFVLVPVPVIFQYNESFALLCVQTSEYYAFWEIRPYEFSTFRSKPEKRRKTLKFYRTVSECNYTFGKMCLPTRNYDYI
jgi:hypothetical protein